MIDLVITSQHLRSLLRAIQNPNKPEQVQRVALHLSRFQDGMEFLAHSGSQLQAEGTLLVWPVEEEQFAFPAEWTQSLRRDPVRPIVGLCIGVGPQQGKVAGMVHLEPKQSALPLDSVRIVGPQMPALHLSASNQPAFRPLWVTEDGLYSRLIGTIGLPTFARLQNARIAVIGAGGNGSLMAEQLAHWMGQQGRLGLIDADHIELYNLPAWGGAGGQNVQTLLGRPKAEALADYLRTLPDAPEIEPIVASVLDWSALAALKRYDMFVSCVDNPAARYAASFLATLYLRPLLDVATGVFLGTGNAEHLARIGQEESNTASNRDLFRNGRLPYSLMEAGPRAMGADVRLVIPGFGERSGNCLLCLGGVGDLTGVREGLEPTPHHRTASATNVRFWQGRAGSLSVLNSDAVNQGLRMLIAFVEGSISASEHWQMDQTLSSAPVWRSISSVLTLCPLCSRAGHGDHALSAIREIIADEPGRVGGV